jgi:hypothetical protein
MSHVLGGHHRISKKGKKHGQKRLLQDGESLQVSYHDNEPNDKAGGGTALRAECLPEFHYVTQLAVEMISHHT